MKKLTWMVMALFISLTVALPAFAQGDDEGKVVFGGTFTLKSGETLDGGLVVFGGEATLEEDSLVRGDVVILGGRATVAGEVDGDMVVFGGDLKLQETARVEGQLVNFGARVDQEEGAEIRGGEAIAPFRLGLQPPWFPTRPGQYEGPRVSISDSGQFVLSIIWGFIKAILRAIVLAVLGLLIVLFWPQQTERVGATVVAEPLASLGVGLLGLVAAFCMGLILLIAACSGLLIWLAAAIACLLGWTAVGLAVGQRVLSALKVKPTLPLASLLGVGLISLISAFPCLGALFTLIVGSAGVGAVVLTRAGTQLYPSAPLPPLESEESELAEE